jgi:hypothetical protein
MKGARMNQAFLKGALAFVLWTRAKENPKVIKKLSKECKQLFEQLSHFQAFITIPDKSDILDSLNQLMLSPEGGLLSNNRFKDSSVLNFLETTLTGVTTNDLLEFVKIIVILFFQNNEFSTSEKENLFLFGDRFKISAEEIERIISETKNNKDICKAVITTERIKTKKDKIVSASLVGFGILMILFTGFGVFRYWIAKNAMPDFDLGKYVEQNPRLVFRKVTFSKYIAYGTVPDASAHTAKLCVYHVKGSADFQFNLKHLEVDTEKTDYISKQLFLRYKYPVSSQVPIEIDVNIPQTNIHQIEVIEPQPITEDEAKSIAKPVAVAAGISGAYVGGKIGSMFKLPYVGNVITGLSGAAIVGGAASISSYVMTTRFLTGLRLSGNSIGDQEKLLDSAKALIAMELIGGDLWDRESWNKDIREYYEKDLNERLQDIFRAYGWETVAIQYPSILDTKRSGI